jgi:hypothetical protein
MDVLEILTELNIILTAKIPSDELEIKSEAICEDCRHMTIEQFSAAVKHHRKMSRWFPAPFDIISAHKDLLNKNSPNMQAYLPPPDLTDEQRAENIRRCKMIREIISKKWEI